MKPRIEQKLLVKKDELFSLLNWIYGVKGVLLHPDRTVTSTYFDTSSLLLFWHTQEGIVPRKKIRIRCYGNHGSSCQEKHSLETKMTTEHGRFKKIMDCPDWNYLIKRGIFDPDYGLCASMVKVSYRRSYFFVKDVRMTIDRFISYKNTLTISPSVQNFMDPCIAVEVKAPDRTSIDRLMNDFPMPRTQFSKYERGIKSVIPGYTL
jgi:hypothetical protein